MNDTVVIVSMALELSATIFEGIQYVQKKLSEGRHEDTYLLIEDIIDGICCIERSLYPVMDEESLSVMDEKLYELNNCLEKLLLFYEHKQFAQASEFVKRSFISDYINWKISIENYFRRYLLS